MLFRFPTQHYVFQTYDFHYPYFFQFSLCCVEYKNDERTSYYTEMNGKEKKSRPMLLVTLLIYIHPEHTKKNK